MRPVGEFRHLVDDVREAGDLSTGRLGFTPREGRIAAPPVDFSCA